MKITGGRTALLVEKDFEGAQEIVNKNTVRRGTAFFATYLENGEEVKGKLILYPDTEVRLRTGKDCKVTYSATTVINGKPRIVTETVNDGGICNIVNMSDFFYAVVHFTRKKIDD